MELNVNLILNWNKIKYELNLKWNDKSKMKW